MKKTRGTASLALGLYNGKSWPHTYGNIQAKQMQLGINWRTGVMK